MPDQPLDLPVVTEAPSEHEGTATLSISEHAALFGGETKTPPGMTPGMSPAREENEAPVEAPVESAAPAALDRGRERHRAQTQKPGVLIPRLKADLKAANEELERLRQQRATPAPMRTPDTPGTPTPPHAPRSDQAPQAVTQAPPRGPSATADPEPREDDPKYANGMASWADYLRDHGKWAARDAIRQDRAEQTQRAQQQAAAQSFRSRVDAAKAKYPDFEQVAFAGDPGWRTDDGNIVDDFVRHDDAGAEMLYYLQAHPQERDDLLRLPSARAQAKALTLLAQRLSSSPTAPAGSPTAVARRSRDLPPTPPTVVRTEAQRPTGAAPVSDGSLSIADHARAFGSPSRRPH